MNIKELKEELNKARSFENRSKKVYNRVKELLENPEYVQTTDAEKVKLIEFLEATSRSAFCGAETYADMLEKLAKYIEEHE